MRSHYCGALNRSHNGQTVTLCGWVHRRRDHGGVIFLDLRDREGISQVVFNPETADAFALADKVRNEYVLQVTGQVRPRPEGTVNPQMRTGEIEIFGQQLHILNTAQTPPFPLDDYTEVGEDTRLKYRYLDLRRPDQLAKLLDRSRVTRAVRQYLDGQGFIDVETPLLTRATPEGARDYLVPSRTHTGAFFALPQSPQLFKQLLMMAGLDRYYQIVKCFRDEDLRADRQPEFTQIDIETSFLTAADIMRLAEGMVHSVFKQVRGIDLAPFPQMTYQDALDRYGSDKPDLRIPLELVDVADLVAGIDFKVFRAPANDPNGRVAALKVTGGAALSRKQIDDYTQFVSTYGAKGLAWIKVNAIEQGVEGLQSPIIKFLGESATLAIMTRVAAQNGDIVFFGADQANTVNDALGALRCQLGADLQLYTDAWAPVWITDFPLFAANGTGCLTALHHPFTAPACSREALMADPLVARSQAYDLVLNGYEIGGGSIRIHQRTMQQTVFQLLNISAQAQQEKFGFLLDALTFGAPPHGGIAFGLDRLVMLLSDACTIREVIAFPKTQSAACPLTQAPSSVDNQQLQDLHIRLRREPAVVTP